MPKAQIHTILGPTPIYEVSRYPRFVSIFTVTLKYRGSLASNSLTKYLYSISHKINHRTKEIAISIKTKTIPRKSIKTGTTLR